MDTEQQVARHYSHGALEHVILAALRASGKDVEALAIDDLVGVDEFHLGWRPATVALARDLALRPPMHLLDLGSGLGGPARYFADAHGCRVTGIDLTPEFVEVATSLTRRCGLAERVSFRQGSALALPFDDGAFDAATLIHVGMNIADKAGLFAQTRRVLKAGGRFAVYDIMRTGTSELPYPMPWAETPATSFVEPVTTYRALLSAAGFTIEQEQDRRELALTLGREMRENVARQGPPALGLHLLSGPARPERLGNVMRALEAGDIAPVELIARAV